jgi:hypothetical protein
MLNKTYIRPNNATRLENVVRMVYYNVINKANNNDTSYCYPIPVNDSFFKTNMSELLKRLSSLFPDTKVVHTLLALGSDGKYYDVASIDDTDLYKVNGVIDQSFIFIDWSKV